ncbi:SOS response-associated peptidase family protein [Paenibacillus sp. OAS669]|uniref:SOS response-associated peptidase family protein n=1 Tax=Paenibacillus sp. OAS669 TaxID=2663821 RepID=UPI00178A87F8|nr:SOS response-associated peptidase family protein [Paenibacillus sp. OAS669]MBE1446354.1 putative SOS response-associated peptidase YedK [Paenibacillus sp. OAS669]
MCDRFNLTADLTELNDRYRLSKTMFYYANDRSLRPQQPITAITAKGNERILDEFRWGLMPFWAQDSVLVDSEAIYDKRAFDHLLKRQRCIIPASSFDRVTSLGRKKEQVQRYMTNDGQTFAMAGVYDVWSGSFGEELRTCSILIKRIQNNETGSMETVPFIMNEEQADTWLDTELFDKPALYRWMRTVELPPLRLLPDSWQDMADSQDQEDGAAAAHSIG